MIKVKYQSARDPSFKKCGRSPQVSYLIVRFYFEKWNSQFFPEFFKFQSGKLITQSLNIGSRSHFTNFKRVINEFLSW